MVWPITEEGRSGAIILVSQAAASQCLAGKAESTCHPIGSQEAPADQSEPPLQIAFSLALCDIQPLAFDDRKADHSGGAAILNSV